MKLALNHLDLISPIMPFVPNDMNIPRLTMMSYYHKLKEPLIDYVNERAHVETEA